MTVFADVLLEASLFLQWRETRRMISMKRSGLVCYMAPTRAVAMVQSLPRDCHLSWRETRGLKTLNPEWWSSLWMKYVALFFCLPTVQILIYYSIHLSDYGSWITGTVGWYSWPGVCKSHHQGDRSVANAKTVSPLCHVNWSGNIHCRTALSDFVSQLQAIWNWKPRGIASLGTWV